MPGQLEIQGMSIVFVGDFNPKIFQPAWFAAQDLIRPKEEEEAKIEIINPGIVIFDLDWARLQVVRDRFSLSTTQAHNYEIVRDLCLGTFRLLKHTPIWKMGINQEAHYRMSSKEEWHALGDRLAPKDFWRTIIKEPGLRTLKIEGRRDDELKGYIRITIEPSVRVSPGVFIQVNDHYEVEEKPGVGCDEIINILDSSWEKSKEKSTYIFNKIMELH